MMAGAGRRPAAGHRCVLGEGRPALRAPPPVATARGKDRRPGERHAADLSITTRVLNAGGGRHILLPGAHPRRTAISPPGSGSFFRRCEQGEPQAERAGVNQRKLSLPLRGSGSVAESPWTKPERPAVARRGGHLAAIALSATVTARARQAKREAPASRPGRPLPPCPISSTPPSCLSSWPCSR